MHWHDNFGQLGLNNISTSHSIQMGVESNNRKAKDVQVRYYHTCIQTILCMDRNGNGQLGVGDRTSRHTPVSLSTHKHNKNVWTFSVRFLHACAIDNTY
mmetsp:Transcript_24812/g.37074  ORF Transcript_24812/g.37074 Transcript_24812/m.37074 type:complete len:99 (-) Transcript_24812:284-580(-)